MLGGGLSTRWLYRCYFGVAIILLLVLVPAVAAQELPPCAERPTITDPPWANANLWCVELVIRDDSGGELAFTALAAAPDGTLYAARPLTGQVFALHDTDGDYLPDTPEVIAEGLTLPNGLVYHGGALYISGGSRIDRVETTGAITTLVDDLPAGAGFWTGGLTVGPDERLYVVTGAPCDFCEPDDPERGAVLSFDLEGKDRQLVATGLRQPGDVAFLNDGLWTTDTARDGLAADTALDELNRVTPGAFFGWPYCAGVANQPDFPGAFDCATAKPPTLVFPTHSTPLGLAAYTSDTFPNATNTLLVVLGGSYQQATLAGYTLVLVRFDAGGEPTGYEVIVPEQTEKITQPIVPLETVLYQGSGFWPRHPLDVTVNAAGWIYFSAGGGQIFALRPR